MLPRGARCESHWYPIEQDVCYRCVNCGQAPAVGAGRTIAIGSHEVYFTTQHLLERGGRVRLAMAWPAMLEGGCRMQLEIGDQVVRSMPGAAAIQVASYRFRTRGAYSALIV